MVDKHHAGRIPIDVLQEIRIRYCKARVDYTVRIDSPILQVRVVERLRGECRDIWVHPILRVEHDRWYI